MKRLKVLVLDGLILAVLVTAFALYQFVLPQPYALAESSQTTSSVPSAVSVVKKEFLPQREHRGGGE
jgi:hypothetical protein